MLLLQAASADAYGFALLAAIVSVILGLATALTAVLARRTARLPRMHERELSARTVEAVGERIGANPALISTTTSPTFVIRRPFPPVRAGQDGPRCRPPR